MYLALNDSPSSSCMGRQQNLKQIETKEDTMTDELMNKMKAVKCQFNEHCRVGVRRGIDINERKDEYLSRLDLMIDFYWNIVKVL